MVSVGLGAGPEQQTVDHALVLIGDVGDLAGEGKDQVEIADGQELGLALGQPGPGSGALALGTVTVAARVIGDALVAAVLASRHMAAEHRRAAALDGGHDFQLGEAHVAGVGLAPGSAMGAEDIRDLQRWTGHEAEALA